MVRYLLIFLAFSSVLNAQSNDNIPQANYLEDQIYVGLSYITIRDEPEGINQNGFSNSFSMGFIKDIPTNELGNFAFGIGLGYGRNTYFQNVKISEENTNTVFEIAENANFDNNKFSTHSLEVPLEFRWRTSTIDKYKFWRLYAGAKVSYIFYSNSKFKTGGSNTKVKGISEINNLQYGLTLGTGYGTWNFNFYYGLSDLFSNAVLSPDQTDLGIRDFRIGLIFYIL